MADSTTLPGARAALTSGGDTTSREFYTFFQNLSLVSGLPAKVDDLTVRVEKLENGGGGVTRVQGLQSITSNGTGIVQLTLQNDQDSVDPVYYYGTDSVGAKGWNLLFDAFADTSNIDAINTSGIISFDLTDVTVASGGTLQKLTFDAKGRLSEQDAATTDDLTEGSTNLYFTDARAGLAAVTLSASAPLDGSELVAVAQSGSPVQTTTGGIANLAFGASTTSATAGAATVLPLAPAGYVDVIVGGSPMKIPYYAP